MRLAEYLDKGTSIGRDRPCLTTGGSTRSYAEVQGLSVDIAAALQRSGVQPGDSVAILSANDPVAFTCVFGLSRAGAVWCPINPRNEADENRALLDSFDCRVLIHQAAFDDLVAAILPGLPKVHTVIRLEGTGDLALGFDEWIAPGSEGFVPPTDHGDLAMIVGTGGTTGAPKGVMLTGTNLETMTAITLMQYPFDGRPRYLALPPLTHAAGVLCFPILALGGEIVIMPTPDVGAFLTLVERHRITHAFLPPTLVYMLLGHADLEATDLSSMQCFWYGAAPMSVARLTEALERGWPMAQLFGQTEAPMMIATLAPAEHFRADGGIAVERLSTAGRAAPLVTVAVMDEAGALVETGERGEIVIRSSLVMAGYYRNEIATAAASAHGWHHTGDIGFLDADGYLTIVDRAKDMIISGGFNVYSAEVEQAVMRFPGIRDCAVVGLPDEKWGERVVVVIEPSTAAEPDAAELTAFVKSAIGSVKAPKQVVVRRELPRSRVGKVLKNEVKRDLLDAGA